MITKDEFLNEDCQNDFLESMAFESENNKKKKKYYNEQFSFINF